MSIHQQLFSLSEIDSRIHILTAQKSKLQKNLQLAQKQAAIAEDVAQKAKLALNSGSRAQSEQEHLLEEEQKRIIDRRKQLATNVSGAKLGRFMEREIDTTSKTIENLESKTLQALSKVEQLEHGMSEAEAQAESARGLVTEAERLFESEASGIDEHLAIQTAQRKAYLDQIDARTLKLYERVSVRFPGDPVAPTASGVCQKCFRNLPPQLFNQVLSGQIHQCPGCARLLVHVESGA